MSEISTSTHSAYPAILWPVITVVQDALSILVRMSTLSQSHLDDVPTYTLILWTCLMLPMSRTISCNSLALCSQYVAMLPSTKAEERCPASSPHTLSTAEGDVQTHKVVVVEVLVLVLVLVEVEVDVVVEVEVLVLVLVVVVVLVDVLVVVVDVEVLVVVEVDVLVLVLVEIVVLVLVVVDVEVEVVVEVLVLVDVVVVLVDVLVEVVVDVDVEVEVDVVVLVVVEVLVVVVEVLVVTSAVLRNASISCPRTYPLASLVSIPSILM